MATDASNRCSDQAALLLGNLDRIEPVAADPLREASNLAERVAHVLEEIGMLLDEELGAVSAASLFVTRQHEYERRSRAWSRSRR